MSLRDEFTHAEIRVECPYQLQKVTDLKITKRFNEHVQLVVQAILPEEEKDRCIGFAGANDPIEVYGKSEGKEVLLFSGRVTTVHVRHINAIYYAEIEGQSCTCELDYEEKKRSFQDQGMTYSALTTQVMSSYQQGQFMNTAGNPPIGRFILQYRETDWVFLKRLASHFHTVLVADAMDQQPRFWFGLPNQQKVLKDVGNVTTRKDSLQYQQAVSNGFQVTENYFTKYQFESKDRLELGDRVTFQERTCVVERVKAFLAAGVLCYEYVIGYEESVVYPTQRNEQIHGVSLLGEVLEARDQTVKLKLKIDQGQDVSKACWFPYAAQANDIFYCMPEKGTSISLYFPNSDETSAMAVNAVRRNGGNCAKMSNPNNKYMGIPAGKEFKLGETDIDFVAHDSLFLKMDDGNGVQVKSHKDLDIFSKQKLLLEAQEMIRIFAETGDIIVGSGESASLSQLYLIGGADGDTHMLADNQLIQEGRLRTPFPDQLNGEIAYEEVSFSWWELAKCVAIGLAAVAVVVVVAAALPIAAAGAIAVGAAISGTLAVGTMAVGDILRGENSSAWDYAKAGFKGALEGAVSGAIAAVMAPLSIMSKVKALGPVAQLFAKAGISGLTAFVTDAATQGIDILFNGGSYDWKRGLTSFAIGFAMPFVAKGMQTLVNRYGKNMPAPLRKALCILAGEPVDVVSGTMLYEVTDFELPGPLPLVWSRTWYSDSGLIGHMGHGTRCSFEMGLDVFEEEQVLGVFLADGRVIPFPCLLVGEEHFSCQEKVLLKREADHYCLIDVETRLSYLFYQQEHGYLEYKLAAIQNEQGHQIQLCYNQSGYLSEMQDSVGRQLFVTTNRDGRITEVALNESGDRHTLVKYEYNADQDLSAVTDALGQTTNMTYRNHLMLEKTDRNKNSFHWQYERSETGARVTKTWGDDGTLLVSFQYHEGYTEVINSQKHVTEHHYNENKVVTRTIYADYTETRKEYNDRLELVSETDEEGRFTKYAYNDFSKVTKVIRADGSEQTFAYDGAGRMIKATNPEGASRQWVYHEDGTLQAVIAEDGVKTSYAYNSNKLPETITNVKGDEIHLSYDNHWNLAKVTLPDGSSSGWEYDSRGNCLSAVNPLGAVQTCQYDELNRLVRASLPDGNEVQLTYNAYDEVIHTKDKQTEVHFDYTILGSLKSRRQGNRTVQFKYDKEEQLESVTNEKGELYRFERDCKGNIVREEAFDGVTRTYERDLSGLVKKINRPDNRFTAYQHDRLGRVIRSDYYDGTWDTFGYNKNGALVEAANDSVTLKFERDEAGRMIREWQSDYYVENSYDELGNRTNIASNLGAKIAVAHNEMGQISHIAAAQAGQSAWTAMMQYNELGNELERILPGEMVSKWTYSTTGKPVHHQVRDRGNKQSAARVRKYNWGINFQLQSITNELTEEVTTFGYDDFHNLVWSQDANFDYLYRETDEVGNIYESQDKSDRIYGAGSRLEAMGVNTNEKKNKFQGGFGKLVTKGTEFRYDCEGNLIQKAEPNGDIWKYEYFGNGMMSKVTRPDGIKVSFCYDSLGRRIAKTTDAKSVKFIWDGNVPLHEWEEQAEQPESKPKANESLVTWVFNNGFIPAAKLTNDGCYSIITDHLGTPCEAYDADGKKVWEMELDIYGRVRKKPKEMRFGVPVDDGLFDEQFIPFRYQGQYDDAETGLYYNRFRYYSPVDGQYTQVDPIGLAGGNPTLYGYVGDPNNELDPFGLNRMPGWMTTRQGYQRHHLIPDSVWKNSSFLQNSGLNVNGATNMTYLPVADGIDLANPNSSLHKGYNSVHGDYNQYISGRMNELENLAKMNNWDENRVQEEIRKLQSDAKNKLKSGEIKCH